MGAPSTDSNVPDAVPTAPGLFGSIQYLRALAAIMVLLYHVGFNFQFLVDPPLRPHWLAAGVDVFFLISGFVMVVATERRTIRGVRFFTERLARVVPLYWLVTGLFIAIMALHGDLLPDAGEITRSLLFVFDMNPRTHEPNPILVPGWTLNYEMLFYLLFALLIRLTVTRRIAVMTAVFLSLCAFRPLVPQDDALLFRMTSPQPLEFIAGMALAQARCRLGRLHPLFGFAAIAAGFVGLVLVDTPFPRVVHFAPCATLIVAGSIVCDRLVRPDIPVFRLLGDSSYSLYLTHPLILEAFPAYATTAGWRAGGAVATVVACVALSLAFYRWFEVPTLRFFRHRLKRRPQLAPAAA
jgi:exopolysaccharide production protein ExoZ